MSVRRAVPFLFPLFLACGSGGLPKTDTTGAGGADGSPTSEAGANSDDLQAHPADSPPSSNGPNRPGTGGLGQGGGGDDGAGGEPLASPQSAECIHAPTGTTVLLLQVDHTTEVLGDSQVSLAHSDSESVLMRGTLQTEVRLVLRFERCLDLSRLNNIVVRTSGRGGPYQIAIDSPSDSRPPYGTCVGVYCYPPRFNEFSNYPGSNDQARWSDFQNGAPSPVADPEHVIGLTFVVRGDPGDPVDFGIADLQATTL